MPVIFLGSLERFYAEVRFLIPSGFIKYFSNQGFFIAMMALVTLEQFGLVRLVQALFKPSNFMLMAYENYLPKQLKGKSEKTSNKISLNFVLVYIAIVLVSFAFALFGDGVIKSVLSSEYSIDKYSDLLLGNYRILRWFISGAQSETACLVCVEKNL